MSEDFEIENGILKGYEGDDGEVVIPAGVKAVGADAFLYSNITRVVIPEGVNRLERDAFYGCNKLKEVVLPESLRCIESGVFTDCKALSDIVLPQGVDTIGDDVFSECRSLTRMEIPPRVKKLGENAFNGCDSLKEVVLPEGLTEIGESAFMSCGRLEKINLPSTLETIGEFAFCDCDSLKGVVLPNSVKEIGELAFDYEQFEGHAQASRAHDISSDSVGGFKREIELPSSTFSRSSYTKSDLVRVIKPLRAGEMKTYLSEGETVYLSINSGKGKAVRKAIFSPLLLPAAIWIGFFVFIMTILSSNDFFADPADFLILLFFAVWLMPVWLYIGGIVKAAVTDGAEITVTNKRVCKREGSTLEYVNISDVTKAEAVVGSVYMTLSDAHSFKLEDIEHAEEFASRLQILIDREQEKE